MIREYQTDDIEQLLDVWYKASKIAHPFLTDEFLSLERTQIQYIYIDETETWIYENGDKLIGFISMIENDVAALFVDPDQQRKNIGNFLLNHIKSTREFLTVDVFKENLIGVNFYKKYGFKSVKEKMHVETGNILLEMKKYLQK